MILVSALLNLAVAIFSIVNIFTGEEVVMATMEFFESMAAGASGDGWVE